MRWLIRIFAVVLFLLLMLAAISFLSANPENHQLRFLEWDLLQSTVGSLVLIAFVVGALVGLLAGVPLILGLKRQIKRMQKRLADRQDAIESAS